MMQKFSQTYQKFVKVLHIIGFHHGQISLRLHVHDLCLMVWGLHPEPLGRAGHGGGGGDQLPGWGTDGNITRRGL